MNTAMRLFFTYHHSRGEGWACVVAALMDAGFGPS
jgi:hypothetical protein